MTKSGLVAVFTLMAIVALVPLPVVAQSTERPMPMRTPDGQPDISGIFTFRTLTPLQRPTALEGKESLTAGSSHTTSSGTSAASS